MIVRASLAATCIMAALASQAAQFGDQEISVSFDYSEIDTRKDEHRFEGNVRISQGDMSITSEQATAQGAFQSDDSRWTFVRDVYVDTPQAQLRADTVVASIVDGVITRAHAEGAPASFEQRNVAPGKQVKGRAGHIDYDLVKGIVRLSDDVWFSYDGNEFRGAVVVYDIRDERVVVNPQGSDQGRVSITIRPRAGSAPDEPAKRAAPDSTPLQSAPREEPPRGDPPQGAP